MILLFILFSAAFLGGCRPSEPLVAKVGPEKITVSEFQKKLTSVAPEYQNYLLTPSGRRQFVEVLAREKLILLAAQNSPAAQSSELRQELERMQEEQRQRLQEYREYLLTKIWLEDLRKEGELAVSQEELEEYHRKHPSEVILHHILLSSPEEAELVYKRLRRGESFSELARRKSLDVETSRKGGRLPPFMFGEILPELVDVAFQMRVGEYSGVVRSKFGYHILRKDAQRNVAFTQARDRIRKILEKEKLDRHLESLQSKYPVEIIDAQIQ